MNSDELSQLIKLALPTVNDNVIQSLAEKLKECGVESKDDLKFVREEDLEGVLRPIQARRFLDFWKGNAVLYGLL